jgi:hypothetical protein
MPAGTPEQEEPGPIRPVLIWTFAAATFLFVAIAWGFVFYIGLQKHLWHTVIQYNFAAMILLPACCGFALVLVLVLRATAGKIEFEALGFKFREASGPLVFWVLVFLAQILAVKLLWIDPPAEALRSPPVIDNPAAP